LFLSAGLNSASAQSATWCISGQVIDEDNGQPIPSVHITAFNGRKGTVSDENGYFDFCGFVQDSAQIIIGHTAFEHQELMVYKKQAANLKISLRFRVYSTKEVQISARSESIVNNYIPGKLSLKKAEILAVPAFMGSPDVLRGLQLLPGMQSVSEGSSGIFVRGGSTGQNYVLFDDMELMNPTHLMGIYSVFNPLLTDKVEFYKGNAPVHQSARLASSIIVSTRNQREDSCNWAVNLGNIVSNLTYNGLSKNKNWYFNTGVRRSYLDALSYMAKPFLKDNNNYFEQNNYTFYDWNGKLRYQSGNNTLALTWYLGQDDFQMENKKNDIQSFSEWGNQGIALVWKHMISPMLNMKNSLDYSGYYSDFGANTPEGNMRFKSDYKQIRYRNDYTLQHNNQLIRWGGQLVKYHITPQDIAVSEFDNSKLVLDKYTSLAAKVYGSNYIQLKEKWSVYGALALNYYKPTSQETEAGQLQNSSKGYWMPNVVTSVSYHSSQSASFKASYAYNTQNIHLASIASIPLPSDVWMPSTSNLAPEKGHQFTFGYFKTWNDAQVQFGAEAYVKRVFNQLLLKVNVEQKEVNSFEDNFLKGEGKAYGSEFYLKRQSGLLAYTVAYSLGWTQQSYPGINEGKWHDAKYDRRHDLNVQATYRLNQRIDFGSVFIFASGNKATLPTGRYWLMGSIANDYAGVNNYRMPSYHRLDVSMNYKLRSKLFAESVLNFSIINLYSRSNPYYIYYKIEEGQKDYELSIKAKQVSLFPIMPSVSWRFKF